MSTPPPVLPEGQPSSPGVIAPPVSPMEPVVVLVVGIFFWGVAYFLYGQWKKGVASLALYLALFGLTIVTCGLGKFLFAPVWVLTMIDAFLQAKNLKDGRAIREWTFFNQVA